MILIKGLIRGYHKTVVILILTMFIVFSSLHVLNSFTNSADIMGEQLTSSGAYHSKVKMNTIYYSSDPLKNAHAQEETRTKVESLISKYDGHYIEQMSQQYSIVHLYEEDFQMDEEEIEPDKLESQMLRFDLVPWDEKVKKSYVTYQGKDLDELQGNEIAISRDVAVALKNLGVDPLGYEFNFYFTKYGMFNLMPLFPEMEDVIKITYRVESIVETKRSQLLKKDLETLEYPEFFETYESFAEVFISPEIHQSNIDLITDAFKDEEDLGDWVQGLNQENENPSYFVYFNNYSIDQERKFVEEMNLMYETSPGRGRQKTANVDSFSDFVLMSPIVDELLAVLSQFIVSGVLISCMYSFYIHFKNQLRTSLHSISALLIQGVSLFRITMTYLIEIGFIYICGLSLYLLSIPIFSKVSRVYVDSKFAIVGSIQYSIYFLMFVMVMVGVFLLRLRQSVFTKMKTGGRTQIKGLKLSQAKYVSVLAFKRLVTYFNSTLGYALSLGLVVSMLFMSIIASTQIKHIYSKDTFGIQFDYMIMNASADQYGLTQEYSKDYAIVQRTDNALFMDTHIDRDNAGYYRATTLTFYNTIDAFVPLVKGKYPPDHKDTIASSANHREEALVSRRHMQKRDLVVYDEVKVSNPVERAYLFYNLPNQYQEKAVKVYGTTNTLYNDGWNVFLYGRMYDKDQFTDVPIPQYILNLKEDVNYLEFEAFLDDQGLEYISYDRLMSLFQEGNDAMNGVSLSILTTVLILMSTLLLINMSGLRLSMKYDHEKDDELLVQIGVRKNIITSTHTMVMLLRGLATGVIIIPILGILYPPFIEAVKKAFGLYILPMTLFGPIMLLVVSVVLLLWISYFAYNRRSMKMLSKDERKESND